MKYFIASDHAGFNIKELVKDIVKGVGFEVVDLGPYSADRVDYPDFAALVSQEVQKDLDNHRGILICGTGIGMSMSANKFDGIRAALCHNSYSAKMAREHNDANILCLGERVCGVGVIEEIVKIFLTTKFGKGRHTQRVEKINKLRSCSI